MLRTLLDLSGRPRTRQSAARRTTALSIALALGSLACGTEGAPPPPEPDPTPALLDVYVDGRRISAELDAVLDGMLMDPQDNLRTWEMARDEQTSHHLVGVREGEVPHFHAEHELVVVLVRGEGTMQLEDEAKPLGAGSIVYIPRGTPHAFRNTSEDPSYAYVVYSPPSDPSDWIAVDVDAAPADAESEPADEASP